jgi:Amt family ammonium transporter
LATITPGCGFVSAGSAILIGAAAGSATFLACSKLKAKFGYDDSLDTFGVHAIGGTLGTILAGVFASTKINPNLAVNLNGLVGKTLWMEQLKAASLMLVWSVGATLAIAWVVGKLVGEIRVDPEVETLGLDLSEHGEEGYVFASEVVGHGC